MAGMMPRAMPAPRTDIQQRIDDFLARGPWAVVGASKDRGKYGNKVLRCYQQHGREVYAVNPREREIEGAECFASIADLPDDVVALSIITPPPVTERIVREAAARGIGKLWMQPGAESAQAVDTAEELGLSVIAGGPCLLVVLGYRE
jgi:predicted CoA-binding protein